MFFLFKCFPFFQISPQDPIPCLYYRRGQSYLSKGEEIYSEKFFYWKKKTHTAWPRLTERFSRRITREQQYVRKKNWNYYQNWVYLAAANICCGPRNKRTKDTQLTRSLFEHTLRQRSFLSAKRTLPVPLERNSSLAHRKKGEEGEGGKDRVNSGIAKSFHNNCIATSGF
jgi:hypothetical protein